MKSLEQSLTPTQFEALLHKEDIRLALRNYLSYLLEYKRIPSQENSLELMRQCFVLENKLEVARTLLVAILASHHELNLHELGSHESDLQDNRGQFGRQDRLEEDRQLVFTLENWSDSNLELLLEVVDSMSGYGAEHSSYRSHNYQNPYYI